MRPEGTFEQLLVEAAIEPDFKAVIGLVAALGLGLRAAVSVVCFRHIQPISRYLHFAAHVQTTEILVPMPLDTTS